MTHPVLLTIRCQLQIRCILLSLCSVATASEPVSPDVLFLGLTPDAQQGYEAILNQPMGRRVMAIADLDRIWQVWEEAERERATVATPAELRRMTFERYGWVKRPDDDTFGRPLGYTDDGQGGLTVNCFACHGGKVAGVTMPGAGNTHIDLETFRVDLIRLRALDAGKNPFEIDTTPPLNVQTNYHRGVTNAVIIEVLNYVRLNPKVLLQVLMKPDMLQHHDMNAPAWWTTRHKNRLYIDGFAPKTPRQNMPFARNTEQRDWEAKWQALEPTFVHIFQYIEEVQAPKYPWDIDSALAERGHQLFEQTCAECHGTYGEEVDFPGRVIPIDEIGTDPVRLTAVSKPNREWNNKLWMQYYGERPLDLESTGYVAPPLNGIWASAPYFHNGSVPTLWDVLNPAERPVVWKRSEDGYDRTNVGLEVETFNAVPDDLSPRSRRMHYDTTHLGNSAAGHTFPDVLSADEKLALVEYLKTL